jgi:hypothetical protein
MLSAKAEDATRVGAFMRMRQQGFDPVQAAYGAREGTVDFARSGDNGFFRAANAMIPFFNAQNQGVDRFARAFKADTKGILMRAVAGITFPSVALWFMNRGDERVRELPQWQKDLFWIVPTNNWVNVTSPDDLDRLSVVSSAYKRQLPDGTWQRNDGTIWRIPKPFVEGVLFGSIPERVLDAYYAHNPNAFKYLSRTILQALTPNFIPQAAVPMFEQWANRSFFLDRTLVPERLSHMSPEYQVTPYTSETAKKIGDVVRSVAGDESWLGSPIIIDNYIREWTGGLGNYVVQGIDEALKSGKDLPVKPTDTMADVPVIKGFVARFPTANPQSVQDFYDLRADRQRAVQDIRGLRKTDDTKSQALKEQSENWKFTGEPYAKRLQAARDEVQEIMRDRKLSPDQKRSAIDLTYLYMIDIAKDGLRALK